MHDRHRNNKPREKEVVRVTYVGPVLSFALVLQKPTLGLTPESFFTVRYKKTRADQ